MSLLATDFSPLSSGEPSRSKTITLGGGRSRALPPSGFKTIKGTPSNVRFGGTTPEARGHTFAQRAGLRYERKVHDVLSSIYGDRYTIAPSILFEDRTGLRRAIPDGLIRTGGTLTIVEVKLTHCDKAWWQLNRLYLPLLSQLHEGPITCVEITNSFDPAVVWPTMCVMPKSLHSLVPHTTGVLVWKL